MISQQIIKLTRVSQFNKEIFENIWHTIIMNNKLVSHLYEGQSNVNLTLGHRNLNK